MFHPGETVVHSFIIPFVTSTISQIIVSYRQNDHIILERIITSAMLNLNLQGGGGALQNFEDPAMTKFKIELTQEESLLFNDNEKFYIQLNVYTEAGSRHASCEIDSTSGIQHIREVIPNG